MKQMIRLIRRSERGASLIETALVLPLLLLLVGGIVDLGGAFNRYIIITNAAREGARYASKFPHYKTGIYEAINQEAASLGVVLAAANIDIVPDPDAGTPAKGGEPIRVTITFEHNTLLGGIIGAEMITLVSSVEMVVFGPGQKSGP